MSCFKSVKRQMRFETLEARKLLAEASIVVGIVAEFDRGDLVAEISPAEHWENPSNGQTCMNASSNASDVVDQAFSSPLSNQDSVVVSHSGAMVADHSLTTGIMNTNLADHIMNTNLPDHLMNTDLADHFMNTNLPDWIMNVDLNSASLSQL